MAVDRLNIVAHDTFQEIIDEANRPDSSIRVQTVVLDPAQLGQKTVTVVSQPLLSTRLGLKPQQATGGTILAGQDQPPVFTKPEEQKVAQIAWDVIRKNPEIQAAIVKAVEEQHRPVQMELEGVTEKPDIPGVVAKVADLVRRGKKSSVRPWSP
jgi:type III restriction enzyme